MENRKQTEEWHDWVADLFSPSIDVGVEAILHGIDKDNAVKSKIKRVSALDPEGVKKIYEKVHMMTVLDREMKERAARGETQVHEDIPKEEEVKTVTVDLNESCIWNSEEISVLREVMKTVKEQNMQLRVKNSELLKRNADLEKVNKVQEEELHKNSVKLKEVIKANSRLKIHCDHLQNEFDHTNARMTAMEQVFKEISEEKAKMAREVQEIRLGSDKERMDRTKLELKLESLQREALAEKMAAVESVKLECQGQIMQLEQQIKDLTSELNKERKLHRTTKKGLDHLRNHFASLPMSHIIPSSVDENQVDTFQY